MLPLMSSVEASCGVWMDNPCMYSQVDGVKHSGPTKMVLYFTGATNILYTFGGHAVTV